jgi:hypothetical protein
MPSRAEQSGGQDWGSVNVGKSTTARAKPKTNAAISLMKKAGVLTTEQK